MPRHGPSFRAGRARQSTEPAAPLLGSRGAHPLSHPVDPDDRPVRRRLGRVAASRPSCAPLHRSSLVSAGNLQVAHLLPIVVEGDVDGPRARPGLERHDATGPVVFSR